MEKLQGSKGVCWFLFANAKIVDVADAIGKQTTNDSRLNDTRNEPRNNSGKI